MAALLGMMQFVGGAVLPPVFTLAVGDTWSMGAGMAVAGVGALLVAAGLAGWRRHDLHP